jgi:hypothetical protein
VLAYQAYMRGLVEALEKEVKCHELEAEDNLEGGNFATILAAITKAAASSVTVYLKKSKEVGQLATAIHASKAGPVLDSIAMQLAHLGAPSPPFMLRTIALQLIQYGGKPLTLDEAVAASAQGIARPPPFPPVLECEDDAEALVGQHPGTFGSFMSLAFPALANQSFPEKMLEAHGNVWPFTPPAGPAAGGGEPLPVASPRSPHQPLATLLAVPRSAADSLAAEAPR